MSQVALPITKLSTQDQFFRISNNKWIFESEENYKSYIIEAPNYLLGWIAGAILSGIPAGT